MYTDILKYQDLDLELLNLKKEAETHPKKMQLEKLAESVKENRKKLIDVDKLASKELKDFDKIKQEYTNISTEVEDLSAKAKEMSEDELEKAIDKITAFCNRLTTIQRLLSMQQMKIDDLLKESLFLKKAIYVSMKKYSDSKLENEKLDEDYANRALALKKKMMEMESKIDSKILNKYKELRQEIELPVFVVSDNSEWCACGMHIPAALMNKMAEQGYLVCEQCGKYILYKK